MAHPRTRSGSNAHLRAFGCACAVATFVLPGGVLAQAAAAKREPPSRPVAGSAVVSYEESVGSAIVYLEETGSLISQAPPPVPRRIAPASAASAQEAPKAPATVAERPTAPGARSPRIVTRQVADADSAARKP